MTRNEGNTLQKLNRTRPRGKPRKMWLDTVQKDIRTIENTIRIWYSENRDRCRSLCQETLILNGLMNCKEEEEYVNIINLRKY